MVWVELIGFFVGEPPGAGVPGGGVVVEGAASRAARQDALPGWACGDLGQVAWSFSGGLLVPGRSAGHCGTQADPDAAVVLSGDCGGTVFLTAPASLVRCDDDALRTLVSDLDAVTWMSGDLTSATVAFERHRAGTGVWGGDGGGIIINGVWTHPGQLPGPVARQAEDVVLGLGGPDRRQAVAPGTCRRARPQARAPDTNPQAPWPGMGLRHLPSCRSVPRTVRAVTKCPPPSSEPRNTGGHDHSG